MFGSTQYIRDEGGKLLRKVEENRERERRYFASLLNTTSAALVRTIIEGLSPKPVALSLGDPPVVDETKQALRFMVNSKAMRPNELPAELPKLGLSNSSHEILLAFHVIIVAVWMTGEVPRELKSAIIKGTQERRIGSSVATTEISICNDAGKVLLKIVANRLGDFCEGAEILPEEQYGFRLQCSTTDMIFVVRRLQELTRASQISLDILFIDLANECNSVNRVLFWEKLACFEVPPRKITVIRMFHDRCYAGSRTAE